jgi:cell division protease FtsH
VAPSADQGPDGPARPGSAPAADRSTAADDRSDGRAESGRGASDRAATRGRSSSGHRTPFNIRPAGNGSRLTNGFGKNAGRGGGANGANGKSPADNGSGSSSDGAPTRTPWRTEGVERTGGGGSGQPSGQHRWRPSTWFWLIILVLLLVNWVVGSWIVSPDKPVTIPYTEFQQQLDQGNVATIRSKGDAIEGDLKTKVPLGEGDSQTTAAKFRTQRPAYAQDDLLAELKDKGVTVSAQSPTSSPSLFTQLLAGFGPVILIVLLWWWIMRRASRSMGGGMFSLGRSRAKLVDLDEGGKRTTFADVAGIDEAKEELAEIVDMLRRPDYYRRLGASIPKGVLLSGPPGTGKTLLARAVAGEADVPFFSASASEFIEMVVGVGASRVRDLYQQALKVAPSIVFIDEIDAIGRARGATSMGGVDEREQTLNQILTEMDGFTGREGVITMAATNRPDVLDPALLRPGRFDRRVVVNPPDQKGREEILQVHTRHVPLGADIDLATVAGMTPGMTGADLRNLVNEAALIAARKSRRDVTMADFSEAVEKIVLGTERRIVLPEEERRRTAFHESGHALLGMLLPGADPVRKISIIPRGMALGVTFQSPDVDRYGYGTAYLRARITGALGGRAAEELVFDEITTGAESDLEQVTRLARQMVGRWGMSEAVGPITVLPRPDDAAAGYFRSDTSPATLQLVDEEVRRLVDECYQQAVQLLQQERHRLDSLAEAVLRAETLDEADAYAAAGLPRPGEGQEPAPSSPDADKPSLPVDGPPAEAPTPEPVRRSTS